MMANSNFFGKNSRVGKNQTFFFFIGGEIIVLQKKVNEFDFLYAGFFDKIIKILIYPDLGYRVSARPHAHEKIWCFFVCLIEEAVHVISYRPAKPPVACQNCVPTI
jgi:hypothetical protein